MFLVEMSEYINGWRNCDVKIPDFEYKGAKIPHDVVTEIYAFLPKDTTKNEMEKLKSRVEKIEIRYKEEDKKIITKFLQELLNRPQDIARPVEKFYEGADLRFLNWRKGNE